MPARVRSAGLSIVAMLVLVQTGHALAGDAAPAAAPNSVLGQTQRPDESALRYYASLKQNARVEAETQRLRRLNPGWEPPADLWTSKPDDPDHGRLWELFAADKLDELRSAILALQASKPGWKLSADLERKLRRKQLRIDITAISRARRWSDAVAMAGNWRTDVDAADVELLWQVAENYGRTRHVSECRDVLETILTTSTDARERIATIHKALQFLPMVDAERLIGMGRKASDGRSEFDTIAIDITRARISAFLHDAPGNDLSDAELGRFEAFAYESADPDQSALLAWLALKRRDLNRALEHFKTSVAKGGDATVAHGLAHTLKDLGRLREAEEVAYAWREPSAANAILFIDILADQLTRPGMAIEAKRLSRYAEVTLQSMSGEGAQALAWFAYNSCQLEAAAEWFNRAMAWFPKEATAFGHALTLQRLKRTQEFVEIVNRYDGLFPSVVALVFPDGSRRTDDPCERKPAKPVEAQSAFGNAVAQRVSFAQGQHLRPSIPLPSRLGAQAQDVSLPKSSVFPVPVTPESPYRATPSERAAMVASPNGWRPVDTIMAVIDARRVPGVAVMPYERYGRTLMPGWNGGQQPAVASDLLLRSPSGTLWSLDQAKGITHPSIVSRTTTDTLALSADAARRFHP